MSLNNQHAARLREIERGHLGISEADAAALFAGAEALEAVEAYNEHISSNWDTEDEAYNKFRAALARLEGK